MSQATRYNTLCGLTGRDNLDSAYHAAFYLLSYDQKLYETACKSVSHDGIDFSHMKRSTRGFEENTKQIVDIAHNLFSYHSNCKATPYHISRLGYPLMEQVCNAFYIAADQVRVVIEVDKNQKATMILDAEPYQKTKCVYRHLEEMQAALLSDMEQSVGDDMER